VRRILVTGAATWTGGRLVSTLEQRDGVAVFAVDEIEPKLRFASPFARFDLDRKELADHVLEIEPDTVVHLLTVDRAAELGAGAAHEQAVMGAQALFGAIGRSRSVRRVIVKSDAAIYRLGPRSPSVFTEDSHREVAATRYGRELADLEALVRELVPIHDHVTYTILRLAPIFGQGVGNTVSRYLSLPVIPTLLGRDPRIHLLHEDDAVRAFVAAVDADVAGTFNIAGGTPVYLSRIARLGSRHAHPLAPRVFDAALRGLARADHVVAPHVVEMVRHGVALDTELMQAELGFTPAVGGREAALAGYGRRDRDGPHDG
jgi:UDP-glucose 4-epimerase